MKQINKDTNLFSTNENELLKLGYKEVLVKSIYKREDKKPTYQKGDFVTIDKDLYAEIKNSILIGAEMKGEVKVYRK